jgi:hypothetical protein
MKCKAFIFILIVILYSCTSDTDSNSNTELTGNWKLTEVLSDPGDGSGTFKTVESNKIITFKSDGTITSNGSICRMTLDADNPKTGTYSTSDLIIKPSDCNGFEYNFEHNKDILIINYPCDEPCRAKYRKQ